MKLIFALTIGLFLSGVVANAQTGIGTTTPTHDFQIRNVVGFGGTADDRYAEILMNSNRAGGRQLKIWTDGHLNEVYFQTFDNTTDLSQGLNGLLPVRWSLNAPANTFRINESGHVGFGAAPIASHRLYVNGDVRASSFATSSDARLKSQIVGIDDASAIIRQLRPVQYYKFTDEVSRLDSSYEYGFIAQEVRELLPELVHGNETDSTYLSLDYNSLIAIMASASQEQQARIDDLERQVTELNAGSKPGFATAGVGLFGLSLLFGGMLFLVARQLSNRKNYSY